MDGDGLPAGWMDGMRRFYARVDAAVAALGLECRGCGDCCRFDAVDHVLYAGGLERRYLLATERIPDPPDAGAELIARGLRCPFQVDGRCLARDGRLLGCRLHFCRWADAAGEEDFAERWHAELKALHAGLGADWDYRPLLPLR